MKKRTLMLSSSGATRKILFTVLLVLFAAFSVFDRPAFAALTDTTPPVLKDFSFAPPSVDVSSGDATVTVNLHVTDDLSGVSSCGAVWFSSPSGGQLAVSSPLALISGTALDGQYQGTVTIRKHSEAGTWIVSRIVLCDNAGNSQSIDTATLKTLGFATTLTVASTQDVTPPQLTGFTFSPIFVDTTSGDATVTVNLHITDDLSGVSSCGAVWFSSPSGGQLAISSPLALISGTALDGQYQGTVTIRKYSEAGTWIVSRIVLCDNAGNSQSIDTATLKTLGFATTLEVILPSLVPDGTIYPATGGTVTDTVFGARATLTVPPGVLTQATQVALDVLTSGLDLPMPSGFATTGTYYMNIKLDPEPALPFHAPGLTIVLPVPTQTAPFTRLTLFRVDPVSGYLTPEPSIYGGTVVGTVNPDGLSATFTGLASLSIVVGLIPSSAVLGDLNGDGQVDCADIAIVRNAFGKKLGQPGFDSRADTNHDNVVDIRDLSFVSRHLPPGVVCRITPTGAVPASSSPLAPANRGINP